MKQYLLDTNICIYFMKGLYGLDSKFEEVGTQNCFISEITLAELKFGVEKSASKEKNRKALEFFLEGFRFFQSILHSIYMTVKKCGYKGKGN